MKKPITARQHSIIDYALVGSLLTLPSLLKLDRTAKRIYAAEALVLLPYVALTKQPVAISGMIPFKTHGKTDPFNICQFALQTFFKPFYRTKKALLFNIAFTALAELTVMLTEWKSSD